MVAHRHLRPPRAPLERRYLSLIVASAEGTQGCILDAKTGSYIDTILGGEICSGDTFRHPLGTFGARSCVHYSSAA